jgi:hypothetical protein
VRGGIESALTPAQTSVPHGFAARRGLGAVGRSIEFKDEGS